MDPARIHVLKGDESVRQEVRLLERDRELGLVHTALRRVLGGEGGVLMFEGARGFGKTSLLRFLRGEAAAQGFRVLHARGSEPERQFPWAVVRQLFERSLAADVAEAGDGTPLSGPATLINTLFDYEQARSSSGLASGGEELYSFVHGLYWLCCNLSEQQPLLLVIDDVQWADSSSLHFLSYLINRLEGESILVALAHTPAQPQADASQDLVISACSTPLTTVARLAPLSADAAREIVSTGLGAPPHDAVLRVCMAITEGNPLHLTELVKEMAAREVRPAESAVPRIRLLTPTLLAWDIRRHISQLPKEAVALAGAVAVLDPDADPRHCALVAGLKEREAAEAARLLRDAQILRAGVPYAFLSPIARHVVYADMAAQERNLAHRRAAMSLHGAEGDAATVADHLCRTDPGTPPGRWMCCAQRPVWRSRPATLPRPCAICDALSPSRRRSPSVRACWHSWDRRNCGCGTQVPSNTSPRPCAVLRIRRSVTRCAPNWRWRWPPAAAMGKRWTLPAEGVAPADPTRDLP
ncbi:hypothetical protein SVIO_103490 [Streptomyces violaceusniger]|uniref:Orc1-like AAA ATPase domain-containing protein n=1 Tax=Streptomyces violaceusniger TaxID=68280 RepID=A0A4D4LKB1_STRVO|nr:hypothetical protein SVIO_103490 [Streptomyces violaceusniger]